MPSISHLEMQTVQELNPVTGIQPATLPNAPARVPLYKVVWALLLLILGIAGCSSKPAPTPAFVYAANNGSNNVSAFSVTSSSGALTAVSGSPFAAGTAPTAIAADPRGKFVYVTNVLSNNVSAYLVNSMSGTLTTVPGSPFSTGVGPTSVTVDPSGRFAYVGAAPGVPAYTIDPASGALASIAGSPFASDAAAVAVHPAGKFLYATGFNVNNLSAFSINSSSGALTPVTGSPFTAGVGKNPLGIVVDPSGRFGRSFRPICLSRKHRGRNHIRFRH